MTGKEHAKYQMQILQISCGGKCHFWSCEDRLVLCIVELLCCGWQHRWACACV